MTTLVANGFSQKSRVSLLAKESVLGEYVAALSYNESCQGHNEANEIVHLCQLIRYYIYLVGLGLINYIMESICKQSQRLGQEGNWWKG